ncbi:exonuclease domain-containing protein [Phaeocystidibacter marisrubri]|uniref:Exonuclease n=1 Tax=Phaeocystidibacter marisrubri TaxID=1577780 RepID=A0A6L3ZH99_9FLAO|nr:exonuclease domain-containing protein [Phaeocystidibacter marisrubri]KAB2817003.1 exonuclease [Phaeocystidibacter marisrubri]GGH77251.1 exonuclease [Phaeocystidibacter marisrubri]
MYAVIDIETSGGKFGEERIIEVAVFRFDGNEIVDQFISLVNPDAHIQPYVQKLTGITPKMVRRAPKFHEIAKRLVEVTEDAVFVAHNVNFDYRVVQEEFSRLGYDFQRKTLDTITHAQRLIPGLKAYGLETLCESLGILNSNRHRADGDARATVKLLALLLAKDTEKKIEGIARNRQDTTPDHSFSKLTAELYNTTGLYYIHNSKGEVIYLGQSRNLRNQIDRHFLATNERALQLQAEADSIQIEPTGSELIARIVEHLELKKLKPALNKRTDKYTLSQGLFIDVNDDKSVRSIRVQKVKKERPIIHFSDEATGLELAAQYCRNFGIQPKDVAMSFQLDAMQAFYNEHLEVQKIRVTSPIKRVWRTAFPFINAMLIDKGRKTGEKSMVLIEDGKLRGYGYFELEMQVADLETVKRSITSIASSSYLASLVYDHYHKGKFDEVRTY